MAETVEKANEINTGLADEIEVLNETDATYAENVARLLAGNDSLRDVSQHFNESSEQLLTLAKGLSDLLVKLKAHVDEDAEFSEAARLELRSSVHRTLLVRANTDDVIERSSKTMDEANAISEAYRAGQATRDRDAGSVQKNWRVVQPVPIGSWRALHRSFQVIKVCLTIQTSLIPASISDLFFCKPLYFAGYTRWFYCSFV